LRRPVPSPARRLEGFEPYAAAGHRRRAGILLDANESAWGPAVPDPAGRALHRYPDASYGPLREAAAAFAGVEAESVVAGNGSDELLDLALRAYADPGDAVVTAVPGYGMVRTLADLNGLEMRRSPLVEGTFALDPERFLDGAGDARIAVLCSPNNPTGNRLDEVAVRTVLETFDGLVVLDEAYVEFAAPGDDPNAASLAPWTAEYGNLCVLRTMSKAWGLAGIRVGYAVAAPPVVALLDRLRAPYNVDVVAERVARRALGSPDRLGARLAEVRVGRARLVAGLRELGFEPLPSDANFVLVPAEGASALVDELERRWGIRVRDRSGMEGLPSALRITVGRPAENDLVLAALAALVGGSDAPAPRDRTVEEGSLRRAALRRETTETTIAVAVDLDRGGDVDVATGIGFLDHMVTAMLTHAGVSATVAGVGDLEVDPHHTTEDVGLALGEALDRALGDRAGIGRYGFLLPMDESLAEAAIDLSGRPLFVFEGTFSEPAVGGLPTPLVPELFRALATRLGATLHLELRRGGDAHHEVEACFKAVGRSLGAAIRCDPSAGGRIPSTKGAL